MLKSSCVILLRNMTASWAKSTDFQKLAPLAEVLRLLNKSVIVQGLYNRT